MNRRLSLKSVAIEPTAQGANRGDALLAQANANLGGSPYYAVRRVLCELRDGNLVLNGRVPSYFLKQVAQTVVRHGMAGTIEIVNRVQVGS
jgi:hypothetical protein